MQKNIDWQKYRERVAALEAEGMTTSDAQGVADAEGLQAPALVSSWKEPQQAYTQYNREWLPCTEAFYHQTLGDQPPVYVGTMWGCSEPWNHTAKGEEILLFFRTDPAPACRMATAGEIELEQIAAPFMSDIPLDLAQRAHNGTSWTPERRGAQVVNGYAYQLAQDYIDLRKLIKDKPDMLETLNAEFQRYREGYRKREMDCLHAKSRCISSAITGPSNFPTRRAEKANRSEHNRVNELLEFRKRALAAIERTLQPHLAPIMSGDADATQRLQAKIDEAEKSQAVYKDCNAAIRKHKKAGEAAQVAALLTVFAKYNLFHNAGEAKAKELLKPDFAGRIGFANYVLTNNNANIRRMKDRLVSISRNQAKPASEVEGSKARVEDCPADNRVRLFFPGKPSFDVRSRLKSSGFRWSPTLGCWQAYRNDRSIETAKHEAGLTDAVAA